MLLNERLIEKAEFIKEGLPKGILARVKYPIMRFGVKNANNRKYDKAVAEKVLSDENIQSKIKTRTLFGNQEHPVESQVKLNKDETSHIISEFILDEKTNVLSATFDILPSEAGKFINVLLEAGCLVGVSTRADGELEEALDEDGSKYSRVIPESYKFQTVDFTADPSTPNAIPENIIRATQEHYERHDISKGLAIALLENIKTEASLKLIENIKADKQHEGCSHSIDKKDCTGKCGKAHSRPTEAPLLKPELPANEAIKVGSVVKVNERNGLVAHLFPRTQKVIVQFNDSKETVNLKECVLVEKMITWVCLTCGHEAKASDVYDEKICPKCMANGKTVNMEKLDEVKKSKTKKVDEHVVTHNFSFEIEDKTYTADIVLNVYKEEYGSDADGRRGEMRTSIDSEDIVVADENGKEVEITPEMTKIINKEINSLDLSESFKEHGPGWEEGEVYTSQVGSSPDLWLAKTLKSGKKYAGLGKTKEEAEKNLAPDYASNLIDERIGVKVTFANGSIIRTEINTDLEGAKKYYLGKTFNIGNGEKDLMSKAVKVELVEKHTYLGQDAIKKGLSPNYDKLGSGKYDKDGNKLVWNEEKNSWELPKVKENTQVIMEIEPQVKQFLTDNWKQFSTNEDAADKLIKAFKITPEKAKQYVDGAAKGSSMEINQEMKQSPIKEGNLTSMVKEVSDEDIAKMSKEGLMQNLENFKHFFIHVPENEAELKRVKAQIDNARGDAQAMTILFAQIDLYNIKVRMEKALARKSNESTVLENYTNDVIKYTKQIKELKESNAKKELELYKNRLASLEGTKTFVGEKEKFKAKIAELEKELSNSNETIKEANSKLASQAKAIEETRKIIADKENFIAELKESHKKETIKSYVESKLDGMGLKLPKASLAILEACSSKEEVNEQILNLQDGLREQFIQANVPDKISINEVKQVNAVQSNLDEKIGLVMKSLN